MIDNYWAGIIRHLEARVKELEEKVEELNKKKEQGCSLSDTWAGPINLPKYLDPKKF